MNGVQVLLMLIVALLLMLTAYIGFRYMTYKLDERWPSRMRVEPIPPGKVPEVVSPTPAAVPAPPPTWWDELEALRSQFDRLQTSVKGHLADAENALKLARAAQERARKIRTDKGVDEDEGLPPALPGIQPGGWDEAAPAPEGQAPAVLTLLERRRGRA